MYVATVAEYPHLSWTGVEAIQRAFRDAGAVHGTNPPTDEQVISILEERHGPLDSRTKVADMLNRLFWQSKE
ncbi:hypothetical protein ACFQ36_05900 [Arthrobacter sp. GCM10027362]|uniref:hypothetical protein n=1 Tax=Arthrobacter sp. GCM10027362 TaxID=3273379 RepID=UPI0036416050